MKKLYYFELVKKHLYTKSMIILDKSFDETKKYEISR